MSYFVRPHLFRWLGDEGIAGRGCDDRRGRYPVGPGKGIPAGDYFGRGDFTHASDRSGSGDKIRSRFEDENDCPNTHRGSDAMIAVTFALPNESSAFVRLLRREGTVTPGSHRTLGALQGRAVCVLHTGVGQKNARQRISSFLREQTPQLLVSSGFAGALHDGIRVGDLLLALNYSTARLISAAQSVP